MWRERLPKKVPFEVVNGVNQLIINNTQTLPGGIYFLRVNVAGKTIQKRVIKQNQ